MTDRPLVAALTDYGDGPYRALLEASARYPHAPHLQWLDLDHGIALGDVRAGALTLRRTVPHLPACVAVAVVDPGVGTERRAVAVATASGHRLVGPDNGLLEPAVRRLGGAVALVDLEGTTFRARARPAPSMAATCSDRSPARWRPGRRSTTWGTRSIPARWSGSRSRRRVRRRRALR